MFKPNTFFILILLLPGIISFGQLEQNHSDQKLPQKTSEPDTAKVNRLLSLADKLYGTNPDEALEISTEALEMSRQINYKSGEAYALKFVGAAHAMKGQYADAYLRWEEALDIFRTIGDKEGESNILSNLGVLDNYQGVDTLALERYHEALEIAEKVNDTLRIITVLNNIGLIYSNKPASDSLALDNYQKALELSQETGYYEEIASISHNIGEIYYNNGDLSTALEYFETAVSAFRESGSLNITTTFNYIGKIYAAMGNFQMALQYQQESYDMSKAAGARRQQLISQIALAETYFMQKDYNRSRDLNEMALTLSSQLGARNEKMTALRNLAETYKELGQYMDALMYLEQAWSLKDTIFSEVSQEQINTLRARYEFQNMYQIIQQQQELNALQEEKNRQKTIALMFFILGFTANSVFVVLLFRTNKQKRKANRILEEQNILISGQKQEITDSIRYASKIQGAVLTPVDDIANLLPDHFILYKPRDIVSGDFYWITSINERIMCVIADCTGHGVPGAFMSMLGVAFLNEIISRQPDIKANELLNELRDHVIHSLHQQSAYSGTTDGMDLAAFIIEKDRATLQYAGANNPLLLFRGGELIEYKPDKMPIGIHENSNESFTNHVIKYKKDDVLYAFSDGFPDQFGGPKGKKFMIKNFKSQLANMHQHPMKKQKQLLEKVLDDWMSGVSQIDDILVMGVRL